MMNSLQRLVAHARRASPYFAAHFALVPESGWRLADLPLTDPRSYWCVEQGLARWPVLTAGLEDALIFKTGGSGGQEKCAVYTRAEWRAFVSSFGHAMATQLQPGDRVANLFYAGDLYASFLFIHDALQQAPLPLCEYPFSGAVEFSILAQAIESHGITVLAGVPSRIVQFAQWLAARGACLPTVRTVLYGGETLFADQIPLLTRVFPAARCASVGYASVDAGLLGASSPDCRLGEHRVFEAETLVEILDEDSGAPLDEPGQSGQLVVTSLTRRLTPLIRYPVGDRAAWVEPAGSPRRKFVLNGRSSLGQRIRLGLASLFPDEIEQLIRRTVGDCAWQMVLERGSGQGDALRVCVARTLSAEDQSRLQAMLGRLIAGPGGVLTFSFEVRACAMDALYRHARSGKLLRVVDLRSHEVMA